MERRTKKGRPKLWRGQRKEGCRNYKVERASQSRTLGLESTNTTKERRFRARIRLTLG